MATALRAVSHPFAASPRILIAPLRQQARMASSSSSSSSPSLASSSCKACNASSEPVASTSYASLLAQLGNTPDLSAEAWQIGSFEPLSPPGVDVLRRAFRFRNFKTAQAFAQRIGNEVAEVEKHHPALITEWGKVSL